MEKQNLDTQTAPEETPTVAETEEPGTVETLMERMRAPREKIPPPKFVEGFRFLDGSSPNEEPTESAAESAPGEQAGEEPLNDEDRRSAEYLNYDDEHRTTAIWVIRTIDRGMGMLCGLLSGDKSERYYKYQSNQAIGDDYLDVTAALVKKYQARLSLEFVFVTILLASYVPSVTAAYKLGRMRRTSARPESAPGTNQRDGETKA